MLWRSLRVEQHQTFFYSGRQNPRHYTIDRLDDRIKGQQQKKLISSQVYQLLLFRVQVTVNHRTETATSTRRDSSEAINCHAVKQLVKLCIVRKWNLGETSERQSCAWAHVDFPGRLDAIVRCTEVTWTWRIVAAWNKEMTTCGRMVGVGLFCTLMLPALCGK